MAKQNFNLISLLLLGVMFVLVLIPMTDAFAASPNLISSGAKEILSSDAQTNLITMTGVTVSGSNRTIAVAVGLDHTEIPKVTVSGVSLTTGCGGPTAFTQVPNSISTNTYVRNEIWYLVNPGIGAGCEIKVTLSGNVGNFGFNGVSSGAFASFIVLTNVDQINPIESSLTKTNNTATLNAYPSASISTTADYFVFDVMTTSDNDTGQLSNPMPDTDQTAIGGGGFSHDTEVSPFAATTAFSGGSSYRVGNPSEPTMNWFLSNGAGVPDPGLWAISAIAIRSADLPPISVTVVSSAENVQSRCDEDCTPPTLGVDNNGRIMVDDGFTYNDYTTDVNLYHTPFPLITVNVGDENIAILKIYENSGVSALKHVGLAFGLASGQVYSNSPAQIAVDFNFDGTQTVSVYDPHNALENIRVETDVADCSDTIVTPCTVVTIYHTFRTPLQFNMVSTDIWDQNLNSWQNTYNHGIHITGDSLNPPNTVITAFGEKNMRGLYELTQTDIYNNLWMDEFGSVYVYMGNNRFDRILSPANQETRDILTSHGCDRQCNWFIDYKAEQSLLATDTLHKILQNKDIKGTLGESFTIPVKFVPRSENIELQNLIISEIQRSAVSFDQIYSNPEKPINKFE